MISLEKNQELGNEWHVRYWKSFYQKQKDRKPVSHSCNQPVTINIWNFPSVSRDDIFLNSATRRDIVAFLEAV